MHCDLLLGDAEKTVGTDTDAVGSLGGQGTLPHLTPVQDFHLPFRANQPRVFIFNKVEGGSSGVDHTDPAPVLGSNFGEDAVS